MALAAEAVRRQDWRQSSLQQPPGPAAAAVGGEGRSQDAMEVDGRKEGCASIATAGKDCGESVEGGREKLLHSMGVWGRGDATKLFQNVQSTFGDVGRGNGVHVLQSQGTVAKIFNGWCGGLAVEAEQRDGDFESAIAQAESILKAATEAFQQARGDIESPQVFVACPVGSHRLIRERMGHMLMAGRPVGRVQANALTHAHCHSSRSSQRG